MKIGFIGLGIMGKPMAKNLQKAGHALVVYDHHPENVDELVALGAEGAESVKEVAKETQVIITMVQNAPNVRAICLGEEGLMTHADKGTIVVDMSSIDPLESRAIGARLAEKNIAFLDAPVSGGEPKAIDGTLSVMVGGAPDVFEKIKPLFLCMASSVVYVGALGSGNVAKLANQVIVACNIAALAEALTLAKKLGADPQKVYAAIRGGLAASTVMDAKAPMMLKGDFTPGFRVDLHIKDLNNALHAAQEKEAALPLTNEVMAMFQTLQAQGEGAADHSILCQYYEQLSHVSIKEDPS